MLCIELFQVNHVECISVLSNHCVIGGPYMNGTIQDWGDALIASLAGAMALFFSAIPKILGFAIILIIGWIIATLFAKAIRAVLHAVNFNGMAERSGLSDFVTRMGVNTDPAGVLAYVAK